MSPGPHCPYCITAFGFRVMARKPSGAYSCSHCDHTSRPDDDEYRCACSRCRNMTLYIEDAYSVRSKPKPADGLPSSEIAVEKR